MPVMRNCKAVSGTEGQQMLFVRDVEGSFVAHHDPAGAVPWSALYPGNADSSG